jgi:O-antigen/teichoic acid export membrane protein
MVFRARDQMGRDAAVSVANKVLVLGVALPALAAGAGIPGVVFAQAVAGAAALGVAVSLYRGLECRRCASRPSWRARPSRGERPSWP